MRFVDAGRRVPSRASEPHVDTGPFVSRFSVYAATELVTGFTP